MAESRIDWPFMQDLIEAIVSLPQNLFYGASIPGCILIMRSNITGHTPNPNKPENRRGRVLFINADDEYLAGRAQNYLRPEDIEKIASTYERYAEVPNYSRVVLLEEITNAANDCNLNVRRYVDNSPPPEPHDVRAHLAGGIPVSEIEDRTSIFESFGFAPDVLFARRPDDNRYRDFNAEITERPAIARIIETDAGFVFRKPSWKELLWHEVTVKETSRHSR